MKAKDIISKRPKPEFGLDVKDLPAIKKWEVGKTYKLKMTVKQVSKSENDNEDYDPGLHARFKITKIEEDK